MPRLLIAVIAFGVLISACQPLSDVEPTTADGSDATTTRHDEEADPDLIVVTTGGNAIAVYRATGEQVAHVNPPAGHAYRQPTWLDDATIVFSDVSDSGDHALTAADADGDGTLLLFSGSRGKLERNNLAPKRPIGSRIDRRAG